MKTRLNIVPFVSVDHMMRLVNAIGVERFLADLSAYIEEDFRRWKIFDKTPRIAWHSTGSVIELMPTSDGCLYGFKYVNGHPKNTREGRQTVTAFGVLADVGNGYPMLLSERRVYELARKLCGRQPEWLVSVPVLAKKTGSASPVRVFRAMLGEMIRENRLPDYLLSEEPGDILRVTPRTAVIDPADGPHVRPAALEEARALCPGADVYALEAEWRAWWASTGRPRLRSPDAAFLGWVRTRSE